MEVHGVRKAVELKYDTDTVLGDKISVFGEEPAGSDNWEKKFESANDGIFVVHYGLDYEGESSVKVEGSDGGEDSLQFDVP